MVSPEPGDPAPSAGRSSRSIGLAPAGEHESDGRCIVRAGIFIVAYAFALPVLLEYARPFMGRRAEPVNIECLFALSQFFMAWIVGALFVRAANIFVLDVNQRQETNRQAPPPPRPPSQYHERVPHLH
jgi:uncharacterized membrane protein (DUF485 family)